MRVIDSFYLLERQDNRGGEGETSPVLRFTSQMVTWARLGQAKVRSPLWVAGLPCPGAIVCHFAGCASGKLDGQWRRDSVPGPAEWGLESQVVVSPLHPHRSSVVWLRTQMLVLCHPTCATVRSLGLHYNYEDGRFGED